MKNIVFATFMILFVTGCVPLGGNGYQGGLQPSFRSGFTSNVTIGTRGRVQPYGGSVYTGTGYTNPELVMAAHQARQRWSEDAQTTSVSVPLQSTTGAPQTVNQNLQARIEALEDQAAEDHLPQ